MSQLAEERVAGFSSLLSRIEKLQGPPRATYNTMVIGSRGVMRGLRDPQQLQQGSERGDAITIALLCKMRGRGQQALQNRLISYWGLADLYEFLCIGGGLCVRALNARHI
jgi:hypothetical protein